MVAQRKIRYTTVLLLAASVLLALGAARGQDRREIDRVANELYATLMSPFCPGRTLENCPSPQAAQLREDILEKLAAGATRGEVVDQLHAVYGDVILAVPRARGFGLLAWMVPGLFFVAGVLIMVQWLRGSKAAAGTRSAPSEQLDRAARERLDTELSKL